MDPCLFSLVSPPPPGFHYRAQLVAREVRRGAFALYAPTFEAGERALAAWPGSLYGILIAPSTQLAWPGDQHGLMRLGVRPQDLEHLPAWMEILLAVVREKMQAAEHACALGLEVERLAADRTQAATEFAAFRSSLMAENSERRRAEQALRAGEVRFRTIFNSVNDAIFIHHAQTGEILEVNQRACELYGYTEAELKNISVGDLSAPETIYDGDRALERIRGAVQQPQHFAWHARHKSGRLFWVEVSMRAAFILGIESVLVTLRDITERVQAEESRRNLEVQLQQTQKLESLGVLAGGIAHDFNNLLLAILGNLDLALAELPASAPGRNFLSALDLAARRAADLCRQLLAYAGKGHFMVQPVSLNDLITEMDHLLEISISKKAVLRRQLSSTLPAVNADATQMRQIIMNLVINASEALGETGGTITLSTGELKASRAYLDSATLGTGLTEGHYVYLECADNGCGMPPDTIARVFDPFFTTKFTGRGLGLATVYGIARSHQGAIKLESETGRGTKFRILLPALQQSAGPLELPPSTPDEGWRGEGAILVVDDEATVRDFTQHAIQKMGFRVHLAEDGRQALDIFDALRDHPASQRVEAVACVLLDLTMPRMDGEETYKALRTRQPDLRILLTSGYSEQEVVPRFTQDEHTRFLQKPYRAADLRAALKAILETPGRAPVVDTRGTA